MIGRIRLFLEMIRFSHTVFALPFALLAALMAWKLGAAANPPVSWRWQELLGILLCMVFARSAAMAFNRIADRRIDALNPRTAGRHLPAGLLSMRGVLAFASLCSLSFMVATLLFLPNTLPLFLSAPVLAFLFLYSYTKRFTALAHVWLGAALMLAPVCAWIAIRGAVVGANPLDLVPALVLGVAVLFWVTGFDVIYALQDLDFDRQAGLHSIPARFGVVGALRIATACHAASACCLWLLPAAYPLLGWPYFLGVAVVTALLVYEHWIISPRDLRRVNEAFFQVNAVISIGLLCVAALDLLR